MKKIITLTFAILCLFAVVCFAQETKNPKSYISVIVNFPNNEKPLKLFIPVNLMDAGEMEGVGGGSGTSHCYDKSPTCQYTYSGFASELETNLSKVEASFSVTFSPKWEKCNVKKEILLTKSNDIKMKLNCDMKLTAKFVQNSKKEN